MLLELADHLCDVRNRHLLAMLRAEIEADGRFEIVSTDQATLQRAIDIYNGRPDKDWSLTDCTSFVIMAEGQIFEAWTADHHFEQAGFRAALK